MTFVGGDSDPATGILFCNNGVVCRCGVETLVSKTKILRQILDRPNDRAKIEDYSEKIKNSLPTKNSLLKLVIP